MLKKIKTRISRHLRIPPEHIGYAHFGDNIVPEYRCPAEDCGMGVSDGWIRCPYCEQKLGEFKENRAARFVTLELNEEVANAGIREDIAGD